MKEVTNGIICVLSACLESHWVTQLGIQSRIERQENLV